ncbi:hypothetical protein [Sphingobium sp. B2]|uniref:hypothetical protein n=1 Tax=Sphingobium sp. B2 TaxID=2583228 RepID=UPI003965804E
MGMEKGRGAAFNTQSARFSLPQRETDGDWLDAVEDIDGPFTRTRTQVTIEHPRTIITRNKSPDIGFDQSINAYRGCDQHDTVTCHSEAALTLSDADEFFDQNRPRAIAKVSLCSLLSTYPTIEPDTKFAPHRFSLFPVGHSPSLRVKLLTAFAKTFDGGSILDGNEPAVFGPATIEPAVLEVGEPIADHQLARSVSHVLISYVGSGVRSGGCNEKCEDRRHVDSLSEPPSDAMVLAW